FESFKLRDVDQGIIFPRYFQPADPHLRAGLIGYTPGDNKAIGIVRLVAVDTTAGFKKAPPDLPAFAVRQRCTLHT
ncbi:hypothetical protein MRX96_039514, partial [Rhipicephalus microplus]